MESRKTTKNPYRNVLPFLPGLRKWLTRYKEVLRQHVEEHRVPITIHTKSTEIVQEFPKVVLDFEKKLKAIAEKKKEKEFVINISLPKFLLEQNETFEQRSDSKENKITENKKKKSRYCNERKKS